jgi:hypothetical protein
MQTERQMNQSRVVCAAPHAHKCCAAYALQGRHSSAHRQFSVTHGGSVSSRAPAELQYRPPEMRPLHQTHGGQETGSSLRRRPEAVVTEKSPRWRYCFGGYTKGMHGFDAIIIGFYRGKKLIYTSRVRAAFVPATERVDSVSNRSSTFNE